MFIENRWKSLHSLFSLLFFALILVVLQGKLSGYGVEEQLPTIAIVAHYDAFGAAPVREHIIFLFL